MRIGRGRYVEDMDIIVEQRHMSHIPNTAKQPFFFPAFLIHMKSTVNAGQ